MNTKSILSSVAIAVISVGGTQVAGAAVQIKEKFVEKVVVAGAGADYVRACDEYGAGFFGIPGVDTCFKIGGSASAGYTGSTEDSGGTVDYSGSLSFEARSETELGLLVSTVGVKGSGSFGALVSGYEAAKVDTAEGDADETEYVLGDSWSPGDVVLTSAVIKLAGFRVGYGDDYFGGASAVLAEYTFNVDKFSVTAGGQFTPSYGSKFSIGSDGTGSGDAEGEVRVKPDFYVGGEFSSSVFDVFGRYYYDTSVSNGAYKVGATVNFLSPLPGGSVSAWYASDNGKTDYVKGTKWGVDGSVDIFSGWSLYAGYSTSNITANSISDEGDSSLEYIKKSDMSRSDSVENTFKVGANWFIVDDLKLNFEYMKKTGSETDSTYTVRVTRSF